VSDGGSTIDTGEADMQEHDTQAADMLGIETPEIETPEIEDTEEVRTMLRRSLNIWMEDLDANALDCLDKVAEVLFLDQRGVMVEI